MQSMTGYGVATGKVGRGFLYIELKTINHRYCDVVLRVPPRMNALEVKLREYLQGVLERGKADLFIKEVEPLFGSAALVLNVGLAKEYQEALRKLQKALHLRSDVDLLSRVGIDHFVQTREKEGSYLNYWGTIQRLLAQALKQVTAMRKQEGAHLLKDQKERLKSLQKQLREIEHRASRNAKARRNSNVGQVNHGNGNPSFPTDRMDITEEVIRLNSHTQQYWALLKSREPVGRKLDFLIQEMHREMNTVGAKAADAQISNCVVEGKSLLENLREQVQNIV